MCKHTSARLRIKLRFLLNDFTLVVKHFHTYKWHMHAGGLTNIGWLDQTLSLALPAEFALMCPTLVSKCLYRKLSLPWYPADLQLGMPVPLDEH